MSKTLKYPNGEIVPLKDVWDVIDQQCMFLAEDRQVKREAKELGITEAKGYSEEEVQSIIKERNRLLQYLVENHGDKLKPQAKYTVVTKEKNEKNRHFRKGEYRLFMGEWGVIIIEIGVTTDHLDVDPKMLKRVLTVYDDKPFREAKTAEDRKNLLKEFVRNQ